MLYKAGDPATIGNRPVGFEANGDRLRGMCSQLSTRSVTLKYTALIELQLLLRERGVEGEREREGPIV